MSKDTGEKQERYTIQSIDEALDLIELLGEHGNVEGAVISMSGAMHRFADDVLPDLAERINISR